MRILNANELCSWDNYTIKKNNIESIDLMERASLEISNWIKDNFKQESSYSIICGQGNNGGDGLALARLLRNDFNNINVYALDLNPKRSEDNRINLDRLQNVTEVDLKLVKDKAELNTINPEEIIIDAIFGYGISGDVKEPFKGFIEKMNILPNKIISIDVPSGMNLEHMTNGSCVKANWTCSFQVPKLSFFMESCQEYIGVYVVLDIGLDEGWNEYEPRYTLLDLDLIKKKIKSRKRFSHKGNYGHLRLFCGSHGMYGASILSSRAALKTGCGLVTLHLPKMGFDILQSSVPEAMVKENIGGFCLKEMNIYSDSNYAIGCGIGQAKETLWALQNFLEQINIPIVLDADALNLISKMPNGLSLIPENSIITPHPKEFERLFGKTKNDWERMELQQKASKKYKINIVLKTAYTKISNTDGIIFINSTGNPGMATAGSGDVLTGIIGSLLAQNYSPINAAIIGCFIHGQAGDFAAADLSLASLTASDIISHLPKVFSILES